MANSLENDILLLENTKKDLSGHSDGDISRIITHLKNIKERQDIQRFKESIVSNLRRYVYGERIIQVEGERTYAFFNDDDPEKGFCEYHIHSFSTIGSSRTEALKRLMDEVGPSIKEAGGHEETAVLLFRGEPDISMRYNEDSPSGQEWKIIIRFTVAHLKGLKEVTMTHSILDVMDPPKPWEEKKCA